MAGTLHAELTADSQHIVILAVGDAMEQRRMGEVLALITPALRTSKTVLKIEGGVVLPVTWPTVVQLDHTFRGDDGYGGGNGWIVYGPRLKEWILAELDARQDRDDPLPVKLPEGCVPRDYQVNGARSIGYTGRFLVLDDPGPQPVTTPIWTPDGWNELGSLQPGDLVYDLHGRQVPVRAIKYFGEQPIYRVTFSDRTSTLATGNHRWRVWTKNDRKRPDTRAGREGRVLSTDELRAAGLNYPGDNAAKFNLPQQPVLTAPASEPLPLDPYAYGALLGDGSLGGTGLSITCPDNEILLAVASAASALGTSWKWNTPAERCQNIAFHRNGKLRAALTELDACHRSENKSIHPRYLLADEHNRRQLLPACSTLMVVWGPVTSNTARHRLN